MAKVQAQYQDILEHRQERVLFSTVFNLFERRTEKIKVPLSVYDSAVLYEEILAKEMKLNVK